MSVDGQLKSHNAMQRFKSHFREELNAVGLFFQREKLKHDFYITYDVFLLQTLFPSPLDRPLG